VNSIASTESAGLERISHTVVPPAAMERPSQRNCSFETEEDAVETVGPAGEIFVDVPVVIVRNLLTVPRLAATIADPVMVVDTENGKALLNEPAGITTNGETDKPVFVDVTATTAGSNELAVNVTVQVPPAPGASTTGEQKSCRSDEGAVESAMVVEIVVCPSWTRTAPFMPAVSPATLIGKAADVEPPATITELGTVRIPNAVVDTITCTPPVGAARFNRTVQAVLVFGVSVVAEHTTEEGARGLASSVIAAGRLPPFKLAVIEPCWSSGIVPAVTGKLTVVPPAAMLAEAGTLSKPAGLADSIRTTPPDGAA
jgi:hypothetical protein